MSEVLARTASRSARPEFALGPCEDGWTRASDFAEPVALDPWLAQMAEDHGPVDATAQAALLIGFLCSLVASAQAAVALDADLAVVAPPEAVAFRLERRSAQTRIRIRFDPNAVGVAPVCAKTLSSMIVETIRPVVVGLDARTRLGPGALWRQAADTVAYGFLRSGEEIGRGRDGRALGMAVLAAGPRPFSRSGASYIEVEARGRAEWFLLRGGCCRIYTCNGEERCKTCVLRPDAERLALLFDVVRERARTEPAQ